MRARTGAKFWLTTALALLMAPGAATAQTDDRPELELPSRVAFVAVDEVEQTPGGADAEVDLHATDLSASGATPPRRVTDTDGADVIPFRWSPDGTRFITQAAFRFEPSSSVSVVDAFGNVGARLADQADWFDWSPDGSRVALGLQDRVWTVSEDGTDRRDVFTVPPVESMGETYPPDRIEVDWAPQGDVLHVVAWAWAGEGQVTNVWFVDVGDQTGERSDAATRIAWRPDGRAFAYPDEGEMVIAPTGDPTSETARVSGSQERVSTPMWRADATEFAFVSRDGWGGSASVWVADADGSDLHHVANVPGRAQWQGSWSSGGGRLAVVGAEPDDDDETDDVYLAFVDVVSGTVEERLRANDMGPPAWRHDGSAVVIDAHGALGRSGWDVAVVPTDGGDPWLLPNPSEHIRPDDPYARDSAIAPTFLGATARLMGPDRVATGVALSRASHQGATSVVIARADLYPDALAGTPLAHRLDAPMLLTFGHRLDERVADEIVRLGATHAVVLGTREAISEAVVDDLRAIGVEDVERIGGADRFETAAMIADRVGTSEVSVVEGVHADPMRGWPDAVAVSALAASTQRPILLTAHGHLPDGTEAWLRDNGPERATIVGSEVAVSAEVEEEIDRLVGEVTRIAGTDRYDTSRRIAEASVNAGLDPSSTMLVTGANWPDALGAGVVAARSGGVLLLVPPGGASGTAAGAWLSANGAEVDDGVLVGGLAALTARAQRDVADLISP